MPHMDPPRCVRNLKGLCPRSDVILVGEGDEHWAFMCRTCKSLRVITKEPARERAIYEQRRLREQGAQ